MAIDTLLIWSEQAGQPDQDWNREACLDQIVQHVPAQLDDVTTLAWLRATRLVHDCEKRKRPQPYLLMGATTNQAGEWQLLDPLKQTRKRHGDWSQASRDTGFVIADQNAPLAPETKQSP